jgi:hypothetical protein
MPETKSLLDEIDTLFEEIKMHDFNDEFDLVHMKEHAIRQKTLELIASGFHNPVWLAQRALHTSKLGSPRRF